MCLFARIQLILIAIKCVYLEAVNTTHHNILDNNNEVTTKTNIDTHIELHGEKILIKANENSLTETKIVNSNSHFPYMCAILRKSVYVSAGALIDDSWVLTGADALFLIRESARELRVRLGSINYKEGGILTPIKYFTIHPYFTDETPMYDVALIKLPQPVTFSLSLSPISIHTEMTDITAKFKNFTTAHFFVTAWPTVSGKNSNEAQGLVARDTIKSRRILRVSYLHPTNTQNCQEEIKKMGINATQSLMCLDSDSFPCERVPGAPVVLNGVLWGIISSWLPEVCDPLNAAPCFASLLGAPEISTWIHAVLTDSNWTKTSYHG